MNKYFKEIIILIIQLLLFYILPLIANNISKDTMVVTIFLNILLTFILSIILCCISQKRIKYFYPIIVFVIFIPSGFIHYNQFDAVMIYATCHLVASLIVTGVTGIVNLINRKAN
jgi:hypothetical protein